MGWRWKEEIEWNHDDMTFNFWVFALESNFLQAPPFDLSKRIKRVSWKRGQQKEGEWHVGQNWIQLRTGVIIFSVSFAFGSIDIVILTIF